MSTLKETHPQKHLAKIICKLVYYIGFGDCWYEDSYSRNQTRAYTFWTIFIHGAQFLILVNICLAILRDDLSIEEQNNYILNLIGFPINYTKGLIILLKKEQIKSVFKILVDKNRDVVSYPELEKDAVKKTKLNCCTLAILCYFAIAVTTIDAIKAYINDGTLITVLPYFYPGANNRGILIIFLRVCCEAYWWYIVGVATVTDCVSYCSLMYTEQKFKTVQKYFEGIRDKLNSPIEDEQARDVKSDVITGIKLHEDALWCARNIQSTLGSIYGLQVAQSVGLLVMCLLKLVTTKQSLTFLGSVFLYMGGVLFMTGNYMRFAGDITLEASKVSDAVFYCGWELDHNANTQVLRKLLVVAIARSQVPVYMTAFGIFTLSYANFISMVRMSYSFFTVMY